MKIKKYQNPAQPLPDDGIPTIYAGELNPAIIKPEPVRFILRTDPITKNTPITHSSIKVDPISKTDLGFFISKGFDDSTYDLLKANCSDATGECLQILTNQDFTSGITTPIGVSRKVRKIFGKQPEYTESEGGLFKPREQSFVVPWYDYRKAKDLHHESILNSLLKAYRQDRRVRWSKEREDAIIKNWWEQHPKLKYDLDEDNNIINPQFKRGGILKAQNGIKYDPTESQTEIPEIQGYKRQFSIQAPQGDSTEENKSPQIIYIQAPPQQPTTEEPVVTEEKTETKPDKTNWSDIKSVIIGNEGFMSTAKALFNEPNASIGYGFFNVLPDGRKITPGMTITRDEANKQLDIAINKLSNSIKNSLSKYNLKTSPEQLNVLIDLGYHAGAGTVDKLLKESNGDSTKIGSLLLRYATRAKYGDTSINGALEGRALRRSQAWNKYVLKGQNGLKLPKFQNSGKLPFWSRLARQLQSAPSNGETTIAAHNADLNRQVELARKEGKSEDEVYKRGLLGTLGGMAVGQLSLPMISDFAKYGLLGGGMRLGAGTIAGHVGEKSLGTLGKYADKKLNTKWIEPTSRIIGGLAGFGVGSNLTNRGLRTLAGNGITMHMPQETFNNLRHEAFTRAANKTGKRYFGTNLDKNWNQTLSDSHAYDKFLRENLEWSSAPWGKNNVEKLIHWDQMTTGAKIGRGVGGTGNPKDFVHIEKGNFVPPKTEIESRRYGGIRSTIHSADEHPIFWGHNTPWREVPGSNQMEKLIDYVTPDGKTKYFINEANRAKKYYTSKQSALPINSNNRYLVADPKKSNINFEYDYEIGSQTGAVPIDKVTGFEYNPLTKTFSKVKYIDPSLKQTRVIPKDTYPVYSGPKHSVTEVVNTDGTVNPRAALSIQREVADNIPGAYRMETRLENPEWHVTDPNTWEHTKNVARSAWSIPNPNGISKQDQMVAALGHDFGKIVAGEGHGPIGADLLEQTFPDITPEQLAAIREHMGNPTTTLGHITKQADVLNGKLWIINK